MSNFIEKREDFNCIGRNNIATVETSEISSCFA